MKIKIDIIYVRLIILKLPYSLKPCGIGAFDGLMPIRTVDVFSHDVDLTRVAIR
jgi:hypothetical protein